MSQNSFAEITRTVDGNQLRFIRQGAANCMPCEPADLAQLLHGQPLAVLPKIHTGIAEAEFVATCLVFFSRFDGQHAWFGTYWRDLVLCFENTAQNRIKQMVAKQFGWFGRAPRLKKGERLPMHPCRFEGESGTLVEGLSLLYWDHYITITCGEREDRIFPTPKLIALAMKEFGVPAKE